MSNSLLRTTVLAALVASLPAVAAAERPPLSVYGFIRLDHIIGIGEFSHVDVPMWVESPDDGPRTVALSLHPRLTRVGLKMEPWQIGEDIEAGGKIEADFQTTLSGQIARDDPLATMRLRHAYFTLSASEFLEILGGQTWDLISPLFPAANNDTLMWNAGNLGDRRPQLRVTMLPGKSLRIAVAAGLTGAVDGQDLDGDDRLDGVASLVPAVQSLIEFRTWVPTGGVARMGVWSHFAREKLGDGTAFTSAGFGGHLYLPVMRYPEMFVLGEFHYGQNLSDVRGGIGQGVDLDTGEEIRSFGGWLEVATLPVPRLMAAVGGTFERPDPDALPAGGRVRNWTVYLVSRYRLWRSLELGTEFIYWRTNYKNAADGVAGRFNLHASLLF